MYYLIDILLIKRQKESIFKRWALNMLSYYQFAKIHIFLFLLYFLLNFFKFIRFTQLFSSLSVNNIELVLITVYETIS